MFRLSPCTVLWHTYSTNSVTIREYVIHSTIRIMTMSPTLLSQVDGDVDWGWGGVLSPLIVFAASSVCCSCCACVSQAPEGHTPFRERVWPVIQAICTTIFLSLLTVWLNQGLDGVGDSSPQDQFRGAGFRVLMPLVNLHRKTPFFNTVKDCLVHCLAARLTFGTPSSPIDPDRAHCTKILLLMPIWPLFLTQSP